MGLIKAVLVPGSVTFFLFALVVSTSLLYVGGTASRYGRRLLAVLLALYVVLSAPIVAHALTRSLARGYVPIDSPAMPSGAQAVVVLTGDASVYRLASDTRSIATPLTMLRAIEAARVRTLLGDVPVVVSGTSTASAGNLNAESEAMRNELVAAGVPRTRIVLEDRSRNTHEHALELPSVLERLGVHDFVLVTSATHARRAALTLAAAGLKFTVSPSPVWPEPTTGFALPIGSSGALEVSALALYEYLGLGYYWSRGWFTPHDQRERVAAGGGTPP